MDQEEERRDDEDLVGWWRETGERKVEKWDSVIGSCGVKWAEASVLERHVR